jgi:hypothetical protein
MKIRFVKIVLLQIIAIVLVTSCSFNNLDYIQHIETSQYNYALYEDTWGIGDPGFYVLKLEKYISPKDVYLEMTFDGVNREHDRWVRERTILFNWSEAGFHTSSPKIKLINNRFLVFERGGFDYALYDILLEKVIMNRSSPWHAFIEESGYSSPKRDKEREEKEYIKWVKLNIHDQINDYIKSN